MALINKCCKLPREKARFFVALRMTRARFLQSILDSYIMSSGVVLGGWFEFVSDFSEGVDESWVVGVGFDFVS